MTPKSKKSLFKKGKKKKTQKLPALVKKGAKGSKPVLVVYHASHEHMGTLETYLREKRIPCEILNLSSKKSDLPKLPEKYSCIFYFGGPYSAVDLSKTPFLEEEVKFMQKAFEKKVAQMGICLGAQLMAKAFGGNVYKGPVKEIGWYSLRLTRDGMRDPLLIGYDSEPTIFEWHEDGIHLPKDVQPLMGNLIYPNQAFRMNPWTYGFQFHFEMTEKMIAEWLKKNSLELRKVKGYINPKKIKEETKLFIPFLERMARRFYENLFDYLGYQK